MAQGPPLPATAGAGGCSGVCGVRACPDCSHGSHRDADVPGTSHGSGGGVLGRLGPKHLGLSPCHVCMDWERQWHGQGGDLLLPTPGHQDPTGGSCAPHHVWPARGDPKGDLPQAPLVPHALMEAGERPGIGVSGSQQRSSLSGGVDAAVL